MIPDALLVLDLETTGLSADAEVVQLGFACIDRGRPGLRGYWTFCPDAEVEPGAARLHGFTRAALEASPHFREVAPVLSVLLAGRTILGHNARKFDVPILARSLGACGLSWSPPSVLDTLEVAAARGIPRGSRSLRALASRLGVPYRDDLAHDALYDVRVTWAVYCALLAIDATAA